MKKTFFALAAIICASLTLAGGCNVKGMLLGTNGSYLFTVGDVLTTPGEEVHLRSRLQGGKFLSDQPGHLVSFYRDGKLFDSVRTDDEGVATVEFTPPEPGDYRFEVKVSADKLEDTPPATRTLLVACRSADAPIAVVDLDKTVVASGFHMVLLGEPSAMPGSQAVLDRLAENYTIVYLTHRPEQLGPKSKAWLVRKRFPPGPVLLAGISQFIKGSGAYKTDAISELRNRFSDIQIGIGDKISDAAAYYDNGLETFLIIKVPDDDDADDYSELADKLATLPDGVQVVTGWDQIDEVLFAGASHPRSAMEGRLRRLAAMRLSREQDEDDDDDDEDEDEDDDDD